MIVNIAITLRDLFTATASGVVSTLNAISSATTTVNSRFASWSTTSATVTQRLSAVRVAAGQVGREFSGLTGNVTSFIAAYAGLAAIRHGIDVAEQQIGAEQRLLVALGHNNELLQERIRHAKALQRETTLTDADILRAEAQFRTIVSQAGLSEQKISDALDVIINRAEGLGTTLTENARQLGLVIATGLSGELGERETAVRLATEAERKSGVVIDELKRKYQDYAKVIAATPFGQRRQAQNQLTDLFERLGNLMIRLQVQILPGLTKGFESFIQLLESERGQEGLQALGALFAFVARNATTIVSVLLAFKALAIIQTLSTSIPVLLSFVKSLGGLLLLGRGITLAGTASTLASMRGTMAALALSARGFLLSLLSSPVAIAAAGVALGELLLRLRKSDTSVTDAPEIVSDLMDRVEERAIRGPQLLRTFARSTANEMAQIYADIARIVGADETADKIEAQIEAVEQTALNHIILEQQLNNAETIAERRAQHREFRQKRFNLALERRIDLEKQLLVAETSPGRIPEPDRLEAETEAVERQYELRKVALADYLDRKDEIETRAQKRSLALLQEEEEAVRKSLEGNLREEAASVAKGIHNPDLAEAINSQIQKRTDLVDRIRKFEAEIAIITERQRDTREKLTTEDENRLRQLREEISIRSLRAGGSKEDELLADRIELFSRQQQELFELRGRLSASELGALTQVQEAERVGLVQEQLLDKAKHKTDELDQARMRLNLRIQETANLEQSGSISIFEAQRRNAEAQAHYRREVLATIKVLEELRDQATDPEVQVALEELILRARSAAVEAERDIVRVGEAMADAMTGPLENAISGFIQGTKSARQAAADFFAGIAAGFADIAARMLALLAIRALFNSLGGLPGVGGFLNMVLPTGANKGGLIRRYAEGGHVPVLLTPQEHVLGPGLVQRIGVDLLRFINAGTGPAKTIYEALNSVGHSSVPGDGPDRDSVAAVLPAGSFVLRRQAVRRFGATFMGSLASAILPRGYNTGGLVPTFNLRSKVMPDSLLSGLTVEPGSFVPRDRASPPGASDSGGRGSQARPGPTIAHVIANDQEADRFFHGGDNALIAAASRNADALKAALGLR